MDSQALLYLITGIVIAGFAAETMLTWLNLRHMRTQLPEAVAQFYDAEKYAQALAYQRETTRFGLVQSVFTTSITVTLLLTGSFGRLDSLLRQITEHPLLLPLLYFGVLALAADVLSWPFQWYGTFVIEEKYGFNRTTIKTFITDKLKGYLLSVLLAGSLLVAFLLLVQLMGHAFWIWFLLVAAAIMLVLNVFYASWVLPLFNKLTPLADGELKTAITQLAQRVGFPVHSILVMDGSKRSSKANAFFSGIGPRKKIVLFDTLINNHTTEELLAVLAHEIGHYKKRHIVLGYVLAVVHTAVVLFVLSRVVFSEQLSYALGGEAYAIHLNLIAFVMLFSPVTALTGIALNGLSRRHEYQADRYAAQHADAQALATALKKLSVHSLSNLYPHPLYVWVHYSHPPLLSRLKQLEKSA